MKIFVLGYTGMLGRYVYKYLKSEGYNNIIGLSRKDLDAANVTKEQLNSVSFTRNTVIINCMGIIKQRKGISNLEFIKVNSVFPYLLSNLCKETGSKLIHITTDCFLPNTKIITKTGVKRIDNVKVGDYVYTHKGQLKLVYELKKKIINEDLCKIKTVSNKYIECTKNHLFYGVKRKKKQKPNFNNLQWIPARSLEGGDLISMPKLKLPKKIINKISLLNYSDHYKNIIEEYDYFKNNIKNVTFFNFKKYCIDNGLNYRKMLDWKYNTKRKPTVYNLVRDITINENISWFLGLFLADGWVCNSKHRKSIHITIEDEPNIINKTLSIIKKEFKIKPNIRYMKNQKSCEIYFTHQLLSEMLARDFYNSIKHYSHTKNIPSWIKYTGRKNVINFIKGYLDGDGCFYDKSKKWCFFSAASVSESLIDELVLLLMFLGVLPSKFFVKHEKFSEIQGRAVKTKNAYMISISGAQLGKLLKMFDMKSSNYISRIRYQKFFEDEKNWYVPITKIEKESYNGFVCNLEVKDDHSYLVGGGLSAHNCVYNGLEGAYNETSEHNATDLYGITKSLGEPKDATIIRTSIIGEEVNQHRSLLEWVKSNRGKEVSGFTSHTWNGITCLQFAKICKYIIDNKIFWRGVKHITSPDSITKCDLVKLISKVYNLNVKVNPHITDVVCDRTLSSIRNDISMGIPDLETQLIEMKAFSEK